ncbi:hypothetical protein [Actinomyces sp.]|uniref:hypothetical protein n=1 Tax=Actinomyces sp. TaxID=29317 RepID=UPI002898CB5E|nr:hypothetical protein [Actinomyces sp.]
MQTRPGFDTYAFVQRMGANVALVHTWPGEASSLVHRTLGDAGIETSLVGEDQPGGGAVMYFAEEDFEDDMLGRIADELTLRGIGAYAHTLVHDDVADAHVDAFTRVGVAHPHEGRRVVLVHTFIHDAPEGIGATTWIFGAPGDLADVALALNPRFEVAPVREPAGLAALEVIHLELNAGLARPVEVQRSLTGALRSAGFEGPVLMTNNSTPPRL